jgi:hypothetical protein
MLDFKASAYKMGSEVQKGLLDTSTDGLISLALEEKDFQPVHNEINK